MPTLTSNEIPDEPLQVVVPDPGEEGKQRAEVGVELVARGNKVVQVVQDLGGLLHEAVVCLVGQDGGPWPVEFIFLKFDAQRPRHNVAGFGSHYAVVPGVVVYGIAGERTESIVGGGKDACCGI